MSERLERLTNLIAVLLETGRPLTLEEIVERVPGYPEDRDSYRRQFERDKATMREVGIPISVEALYAFDQESGYRIHRKDYELPPLDLTEDERVALHLAVTAVRVEGPASTALGKASPGAGLEALLKLGGLEGRAAPPLAALPSVPALPALFDAYRRRASVTFRYRGAQRALDPYGIVFRNGHWYAVGRDAERDAIRAFRADRIDDIPEAGRAGSFERPPDFDPSAALRDEPWRFGDEEPVDALVLVDASQAGLVTAEVGEEAVAERRPDGAVVLRLAVTNREAFRSYVVGLLDHAEVLAPPGLRDEMTSFLASFGHPATSRETASRETAS
ncbi:MAG TPA: WYL domain-containing protein [Acidimicrobiia bacterium]|nr:WYL domain-containing protein [Acidimicrobiia bacterium]